MFQKTVQPHCANKLATMILQFIPRIYIAWKRPKDTTVHSMLGADY